EAGGMWWVEGRGGRGSEGRGGGQRGPARAHPRAGGSTRPDLGQLLASPFLRCAPDTSAPEGAALWPEAWWPTRTPRVIPGAVAGRAGGRTHSGGAGALPALSAAVARARRPPAGPSLAAPGRGVAAAGGAGHGVPDGGPPLRAVWETHPSRATGRGAAAAVRGAPDGGGRAAEWAVSVEPAGSAAVAAGPLGNPVVP